MCVSLSLSLSVSLCLSLSLSRQVANKEESVDNTEARILMAQEKFAEASEAREDSERQRKVLESRCALDGVSNPY